MANEEHVAKSYEGVEAWNLWREENRDLIPDLQGANLRGAQLQEADLRGAQLQKADLLDAQLQGAYLLDAQLQGAYLVDAQLQEADLRGAQLQGAYLVDAQLQKAYLVGAQLQKAILWNAQLQGADLREAQLQGADLRYVEDIRFDDTNIQNIRVDLRFGRLLERFWNPFFIKKTKAIPWIELRRTYTGVNFLLTLVALLAFLFPYILQAGYLQALNWFQVTLVETTPILKESLESVNDATPLVNPTSSLVSYLENLTPCFAPECQDRRILWLILGLNQGIGLFVFNILLVLYNGLRFYVTQAVNILRDEEEQGGWSPKKEEVNRLIVFHIIIKFLFFAAVGAGLLNAIAALLKVVQVPA